MGAFDFKSSGYFSWTILFIGAVLCVVGIATAFTNIPVGGILLIISLIILTTHYRLRIDFENNTFHDYLWILGVKTGERGRFENVAYLFIKKSKVSQTMHLKVVSSTIQKEVYDGYLKFSDNRKIHLMTKDHKNELIQKLNRIAGILEVKVIDYSEGPSKVI